MVKARFRTRVDGVAVVVTLAEAVRRRQPPKGELCWLIIVSGKTDAPPIGFHTES